MDATSRGRPARNAVQPAADAAASQDKDRETPDESRALDAGAAGDILGEATIETATKADGRYVIYYSWPDDV